MTDFINISIYGSVKVLGVALNESIYYTRKILNEQGLSIQEPDDCSICVSSKCTQNLPVLDVRFSYITQRLHQNYPEKLFAHQIDISQTGLSKQDCDRCFDFFKNKFQDFYLDRKSSDGEFIYVFNALCLVTISKQYVKNKGYTFFSRIRGKYIFPINYEKESMTLRLFHLYSQTGYKDVKRLKDDDLQTISARTENKSRSIPIREILRSYGFYVLIYTLLSYIAILYIQQDDIVIDLKTILFAIYAMPLYAFLLMCLAIIPIAILGIDVFDNFCSEKVKMHIILILSSCGLIGLMGLLG